MLELRLSEDWPRGGGPARGGRGAGQGAAELAAGREAPREGPPQRRAAAAKMRRGKWRAPSRMHRSRFGRDADCRDSREVRAGQFALHPEAGVRLSARLAAQPLACGLSKILFEALELFVRWEGAGWRFFC